MVQELLPYVAGALQWARAREKFAEAWFIGIVAGASFGFYLLAHPSDAFAFPWNEILAGWWEQAKTILATVQLVSSGARIGKDMGMKNMPVTNTQ